MLAGEQLRYYTIGELCHLLTVNLQGCQTGRAFRLRTYRPGFDSRPQPKFVTQVR
jgi:hypothetical protein